MIIKLLIEGGDMKPSPAIAQQLGPMGVNMGKVISTVNDQTKHFKGMKIPVELDVNEKTKDFTIKTSSPPTSELIKKELNLEKGSNDHKLIKVGNASIEDIIKIALIKHSDMLEKEFKTAVKSILGTCASVGILVENKNPNELIVDLVEGKFDKEIAAKRTETPTEKRKELNDHFNKLKAEQEARVEREKKAAEAAAAEAAKPAEGEKAVEGKAEATPAKVGDKKVATTTVKPATTTVAKTAAKPAAKKK